MQRLAPETRLTKTRETAHEVEKHTLPPSGPRVCSVCGCEDRATIVDGEFDAAGNARIEHHVTIELEYVKDAKALTLYRIARGWKYKFHQGRHALERFICRPCLREGDAARLDEEVRAGRGLAQGEP